MDCRIQAGHQSLIALARFAGDLSLRSQYARDGLGSVTIFQLRGEWVGGYWFSCDRLVLVQGNLEYGCKVIV